MSVLAVLCGDFSDGMCYVSMKLPIKLVQISYTSYFVDVNSGILRDSFDMSKILGQLFQSKVFFIKNVYLSNKAFMLVPMVLE